MSTDGQSTKWHRNIAENFNPTEYGARKLQADDRRTGDIFIANGNVSSRSQKIGDVGLPASSLSLPLIRICSKEPAIKRKKVTVKST